MVVLLEAIQGARRSASAPVVLADAGVENVNAQVDALIATGVLRRLLAFTELKFSNSMIEAWWRSLKHQWLFLHSLDSVATIRRLVAGLSMPDWPEGSRRAISFTLTSHAIPLAGAGARVDALLEHYRQTDGFTFDNEGD